MKTFATGTCIVLVEVVFFYVCSWWTFTPTFDSILLRPCGLRDAVLCCVVPAGMLWGRVTLVRDCTLVVCALFSSNFFLPAELLSFLSLLFPSFTESCYGLVASGIHGKWRRNLENTFSFSKLWRRKTLWNSDRRFKLQRESGRLLCRTAPRQVVANCRA